MRKNDLILIIAIIFIAVVAAGFIRVAQKGTPAEDAMVTVTIDGEEYGNYPLSEDFETVIETGDGSYNKLVIKDSYAEITEADCPDQICVNHFHIHCSGETIVCLPHRLVVEITGGQENEIDGSTF